jgi:protein SCO1/2
MTEEMSKLQDAIPANAALTFVTLTTDPAYDTPAILKKYGEKFHADFSRWMFLTGSKSEIANLATNSLKLAALEKDPSDRESANDLFIHSTIFVLVDKTGTMRSVYESLEPGFQEKIRADIESLLREN